jgi:hypothetical protein
VGRVYMWAVCNKKDIGERRAMYLRAFQNRRGRAPAAAPAPAD